MRSIGILAAFLLAPAVAAAEQEAQSPFDLSGDIAVVSDYRWRGVSLTDNDPAIQGGVTVAHESGLYANVWGSLPLDAGDEEIDLTVGYGFSVGGGEADISIAQYAYPTVDGFDYLSAIALYSYPVGEWTLRARFEYAPPQKNLWDESVYAALETERPLGASGLTMIAKGGWEKGAFTLDGEKWDYAVGFNYQLGPSTLGLLYAGTDEDARAGEGDVYGGGFVFSASASF